jgi:3D (Asp-Asp-Asp) domain-containing protein
MVLVPLFGCGNSDPTFAQALTPVAPSAAMNSLETLAPAAEVNAVPPKELGTFRNTVYYLKEEAPYALLPKDTAVKDINGDVLMMVNSKFKKLLDIEGSGKLIDGRVINFAAKISGEIRYQFTVHPWGTGVGNCALIPFGSVAVDPDRIPFGSIIKIAETVGTPLPDGKLHSGFWIASDTGSAIRGDRIDLFSGRETWWPLIDQYGVSNMQALHVELVALPTSSSCINSSPR